ncbi:hypothetical protein M0R04_15300 [Candidatus Dojkabacteria bacterium]|jgi:hypothetical protein|nr:hypothetical protein [Candidatus Dojkabacteria bacterium]
MDPKIKNASVHDLITILKGLQSLFACGIVTQEDSIVESKSLREYSFENLQNHLCIELNKKGFQHIYTHHNMNNLDKWPKLHLSAIQLSLKIAIEGGKVSTVEWVNGELTVQDFLDLVSNELDKRDKKHT